MSTTKDYMRLNGTNALVNQDNKSYTAYMQQRERNNKVAILEQDVKELKSDITQIKELLIKLVDGK